MFVIIAWLVVNERTNEPPSIRSFGSFVRSLICRIHVFFGFECCFVALAFYLIAGVCLRVARCTFAALDILCMRKKDSGCRFCLQSLRLDRCTMTTILYRFQCLSLSLLTEIAISAVVCIVYISYYISVHSCSSMAMKTLRLDNWCCAKNTHSHTHTKYDSIDNTMNGGTTTKN